MNAHEFLKKYNNICSDVADKKGLDKKHFEEITVCVLIFGKNFFSKTGILNVELVEWMNQIVITVESPEWYHKWYHSGKL
jgi:hypothetical protein